MNITQALRYAEQQLRSLSETPQLDAMLLLAHVLAQPRAYLYAWPEKELSTEQIQQFNDYVKRRGDGVPVAYIIGHKDFWSLTLKVTPDTLIPRPETECLVEWVLKLMGDASQLRVADLGTGSGAIAIALAYERSDWEIHATDKSVRALMVAKENAEQFNIQNIVFHEGDWLRALSLEQFDVIVSNPPYISQYEWAEFSSGLQCEPEQALLSGKDGLADIEEIVSSSRSHLKSGGYLFLEHGFAQGEKVRQFFVSNKYRNVETVLDLAGHERVTLGRYEVV